MTGGKVVEGVFAINKPQGVSSAQLLRDVQTRFKPSSLFKPYFEAQKELIQRELGPRGKPTRKQRMHLENVKIGHGGTLDPLATGVLIAGVGTGTKVLQGFLECTKSYEAVILFGAATDSYDRLGKIVKKAPFEHITKTMVEEALKKFRGEFMQLPPLYSALRVQGKKLYEYAREGKEVPVAIEKRPANVLELEMLEYWDGGDHPHQWPKEEVEGEDKAVAERIMKMADAETENTSAAADGASKRKRSSSPDDAVVPVSPVAKKTRTTPPPTAESEDSGEPTMAGALPPSDQEPTEVPETTEAQPKPPACKLRLTVTSGFYVRSLAHDLGAAVGSSAIMSELVRTRQGDFELGKNVLEWENFQEKEEVWGPKVEGLLDEWVASQRSQSPKDRKGGGKERGANQKLSYEERRRRSRSQGSRSRSRQRAVYDKTTVTDEAKDKGEQNEQKKSRSRSVSRQREPAEDSTA
ncbi:pseudouridine synthase [Aulographum hederae CBS 113979]|uniref:tRNA pseudouridine(55) synthase n=1 Tax=Aulographum hederae CBS 113979 TaxID=1176131 RepID=A0A6G1H9X0_9PEZI|nr:pseudouridine synthase [Aulographum hederae CBS 113979]